MKTRLQFNLNVAYSIIDGLETNPYAQPLIERITDSLLSAFLHNQKFVRLRLSEEEVEFIDDALVMEMDATVQDPLVTDLHELHTRILAMESEQILSAGIVENKDLTTVIPCGSIGASR